jgi:hypothetical protein
MVEVGNMSRGHVCVKKECTEHTGSSCMAKL